MTYNYLTINERVCIYQLRKLNMSIRAIAKALGRNPSTISREIKRNSDNNIYNPNIAQNNYKCNRSKCHRNTKLTLELKTYIEEKTSLTWSPEQISKRDETKPKNFPCFSTIFCWIHKGYIIKGKTIKQCPKHIYKREEIEHWEADTVDSGRMGHKMKSKYCFVTLAERKSRLFLAKQLPDRTSENVTAAIIELLSVFPREVRKIITCDRGKEFADYKEIEEQLNCELYFADPHCAWQKGINENSNGLLRKFYPKGMDLSQTNNNELKEKLELLNNRPRKCTTKMH